MKHNLFSDKLSTTKIKSLGVTLNTYYCGRKVAYKMYVGGKLLFEGTEYRPSPFHNWDSLDANLELLGFLCVGVGDTDSEYFKDYTPAQLDWAESYAVRDDLNMYISDIENNYDEYNKEEALKQFKHKTY